MSPITHFLMGWAVANSAPSLDKRERAMVTWAGLVPDVDGLGIVADWVTRNSSHPLNWWGDPLQSLFISTCIMGSTAIGSALRHPTIGSIGFWTLAVYVCFALGLLVGQILVYRIYRENIIAA